MLLNKMFKGFLLVLALLISMPGGLHAAARASDGERPEEAALRMMREWIQVPAYNVYGMKIGQTKLAQLAAYLENMPSAVRYFHANLSRELSNSTEFKRIASKKASLTHREFWSALTTQSIRLSSSALATYLVYDSNSLEDSSRVVSYCVSGLALLESSASLGSTIYELFKDRCAKPFPSDEEV